MGMWDKWIGRTEIRSDSHDPALVRRWTATFDRAAPDDGTVPQGVHWCLGVPEAATAALGIDGHPLRDGSPDSFLPPVPLPRRMWAASAITFLRPLRLGAPVERRSRIAAISEKQGGSGQLVFVDIEHETACAGDLCIRETQSIVYRDAPPQGCPPVPPPPGPDHFDPAPWQCHRALAPDEALLFRFSALTFNAHRIHYDLPYATKAEGYRGLVVHGPLTASLLLNLAAQQFGDNALKTFAFRGLSPAICGEGLHLVLRSDQGQIELGAFASDGRHVMSATAALS